MLKRPALNHFATIRCFHLKENKEDAFVTAWKAVSDLYYRYAGSFGSRLHRINEKKFCVYTLWPNADAFNRAETCLPVAALALQAKLNACCSKVESEMEMGVMIDQIHLNTYRF